MVIKIVVYPGGKVVEYEVKKGRVSVARMLKDLGYPEYGAVVVRGGIPLTGDEFVFDGDTLELYEVRSAG